VFRPKRKKRKGRRLLVSVLLILLALSVMIVGAARYAPSLIPAEMMSLLAPINSISLPSLASTSTPISLPPPTGTQPDLNTLAAEATTPASTPTQPLAPTATATVQSTSTAENPPLLVPTAMGGGYGQVAFASDRTG